VRQPPLAEAMEVLPVLGGGGSPRTPIGGRGSQYHPHTAVQDQGSPIGAHLSVAQNGLHLAPGDAALADAPNVGGLRGQVDPEGAHPQRLPHEHATQHQREWVPVAVGFGIKEPKHHTAPATSRIIQPARGVRMRTVASVTPRSTLMAASFRGVLLVQTRSAGTQYARRALGQLGRYQEEKSPVVKSRNFAAGIPVAKPRWTQLEAQARCNVDDPTHSIRLLTDSR
jgi:hypothetical protein